MSKMRRKVILITRVKNKSDLDKEELKSLIQAAVEAGIQDRYVLLELKPEDRVNGPPKIKGTRTKVHLIHDVDPTGPVSINTALNNIASTGKQPYAFLVVSKEVAIMKTDIEMLREQLEENSNLLVAGFKLKVIPKNNDYSLGAELKRYYVNNKLIAFRVPWNTCAMWNFSLFKEYVVKFDEITNGNLFPHVNVTIDGLSTLTPHKGMEDGLAIAKAASKNKDIRYKLLDEYLPWTVNQDGHSEKLARKDLVMRNFMALRDYSVESLKCAELSQSDGFKNC